MFLPLLGVLWTRVLRVIFKNIWKTGLSKCWYGGHQVDDAYHTIFICSVWHGKRRILKVLINANIDPENIVKLMFQSKKKKPWELV